MPFFTANIAEGSQTQPFDANALSAHQREIDTLIARTSIEVGVIDKAVTDIAQENNMKKFTANVSAYTANADECGKNDGITASGKKVRGHHTIACPAGYAFGTKIHFDGYGTFTCEDRGGAIKSNKFDMYMHTKSEAFTFGRRNLIATIVE